MDTLSYHTFRDVVRFQFRYMRPSYIEDFLQDILAMARNREQLLEASTPLWRAQLGCEFRASPEFDMKVHCPHPPDRMKPRADRASEGRTNPKGIPVLHVATDQYTALVEVRPWLGSYVSIAQFHLKRDVRVIDCSQGSAGPSAEEVERSVWSDINQAFAAPVDRQDDVADYAPTQVIAELFRRERYGGVKYRSALSKRGHNIALFDLKVADPPLVLFIGH